MTWQGADLTLSGSFLPKAIDEDHLICLPAPETYFDQEKRWNQAARNGEL
jgi:hypothetical protein